MLILLPPSAGKTAPITGVPVDLEALSFPELTGARRRVGQSLILASRRKNALVALAAGPSLSDEVNRNTTLWGNAAAPSAQVYTGVLFEAAGAGEWTVDTLRRASERVRIFSALWGVLSPVDRIPAYRLGMGTALGRIGPLTAFWRKQLVTTLDREADGHLVIDCRSSDYAAAWRASHSQSLAVRVERELNGKRAVVSHNAKHTRGLLTGALVAARVEPTNGDEIAHIASQIPGITAVELRPNQLTLVTQAQ